MGLSGWILFNVFVLVMLGLDLFVFHRKEHVVGVREAIWWSIMWVGLAFFFNVGVYFALGEGPAVEFLTAYLVEKSLSVDNLFVFLMVFAFFRVPPQFQHRVLFWGIVGALAMRAAFIFAGVALIGRFHFTVYILGAFLIIGGVKMLFQNDSPMDPERNLLVRVMRRFLPVVKDFQGDKLLVKQAGKWYATPLLLVLIVIETTDLIFAMDSIPAVLAISHDPFIVYTSNIFAILGLRSLYFALAGVMQLFGYLKYALSGILVFVGIKIMIASWYVIPVALSLGLIAGALGLAVVASLWKNLQASRSANGLSQVPIEKGDTTQELETRDRR
jgi:tellurite resistance protein TerC